MMTDDAPASGRGKELLIRTEAAVMTLTLNRPDKGNALSSSLVRELHDAIDLATTQGVRLLVLNSAGKHFCTGFDLSNLDQESDDSLLGRFIRMEMMLQSIHAAPFDTLALVNGRVMGAGADIFCACANRWIVGDASFAFPGTGFGLVLGTARLADVVGLAQAQAWVRGGGEIGAQAAVMAGLAHRHFEGETNAAGTTVGEALARLSKQAMYLDETTEIAIRIAFDAARRPRGVTGDALDLARLVRSAARPGLRKRIAQYRQRTKLAR
jgi:enoyl-CoA hydratase